MPVHVHPDLTVSLGFENLIQCRGKLQLRQDMDEVYQICGTLYVFWSRVFDELSPSMAAFWEGRRMRALVHPSFPYADVDTPDDLKLFELLVRGGYTIFATDNTEVSG
jgi:CMP-N-acetylneuraminic acid synthetase